MRDLITEIYESIRRNKLRTCLTGFAVSWGIFMLIVLLGAGNGVSNAFLRDSSRLTTDIMRVRGGYTSKAYGGYQSGRRIELDDRDIKLTESELFEDVVTEVAPIVSTSGILLSYRKNNANGMIEGAYPERLDMSGVSLLAGRFLNKNDIDQTKKVIVIPQNIAELLVGEPTLFKDLVGKLIKVNGLMFKVVGICESNNQNNSNLMYAPYSTVRTIWAKGKTLDEMYFTFDGLETEEDNEEFMAYYKAHLNQAHSAAPDDESASWIRNSFISNMQMQKGSKLLNTALWIVGILTLISGIVGVGNIMLITVKERTHEFGIRKAIGASPWSIMKLILAESVFITAFFGYLGMMLGMFACEILDKTVGQSSMSVLGVQMSFMKDISVGVNDALGATLLLIIAGTLAGLAPARKAAKVRPIEALRAE